MNPRILIDTAELPDGGGTLRLIRQGNDFSIMLGANGLMTSRLSGSEEALAAIACDKIAGVKRPEMLIGGLGMGFTLRAALARLPAGAAITVAELIPAVIAWAKGPLASLFAGSLDDPRVHVEETDVARLIHGARARWDAILLDVDNGPDGLTIAANDRLYDKAGLASARDALRPGGVLAIWSAAPDPAFTRRLHKARFEVEETIARAHRGTGGARHTLWFATR